MRKHLATAALFAACTGLVAPVSAQEKNADKQDRAKNQAVEFVQLMTGERYEQASAYFGGEMAEVMDADKLRQVWLSLQTKYGQFQQLGPPQVFATEPYVNVVFEGVWAKQRLRIRVVIDEGGWVSGLWFEPAEPPPYKPPKYAKKKRFTEEEVTIGQQPWALPGTLTLPKAKGKLPAVVLVHGSGPKDRDELVGGCRPFRDLAWGLAGRKIAVLRYDKRTFVHRQAVIDSPQQDTLEAEVIDDALAALELLRNRPPIDGKRLYVLGHSLGGMCAPDIAKRDGKLAGVIMLAPPARDIETLLAEQFDYQAAVQGIKGRDHPAMKDAFKGLDAVVKHELEPDEVFMGARARYWYHFMERDGQVVVDLAKSLTCPILLLQGGRDCQITTTDFDIWKEALADRPKATLKLFDNLNHLFVSGTEPSTGAEYFQPGHVNREVIDTIADWIGGE